MRQGPKLALARFGARCIPRSSARLDLPSHAAAFEIFLDAIPEPKRRRKSPPVLSAFQPIRRDFAFIAEGRSRGRGRAARRAAAPCAIWSRAVTLFDVYEGRRMEPGRKSLGIEVVFQPKDRSLTDAEIEEASRESGRRRHQGDRGCAPVAHAPVNATLWRTGFVLPI